MRYIFFFLLLLTTYGASAQNNYDVSLIPKELLPYASAVIRNDETTIEVKDLENVTYHVKKVVTILNRNGDDEAELYVHYDKMTSVKYIKGFIYNEFGKVTQKIAERDFEDVAVTDGFSLFLDDRVKLYTKAVTDYPYTIEFEYEVKTRQSLDFPDWRPAPGTELSVQKSSFTFICKPDYAFRYKEINLTSKVITNPTPDGMKTYTWEIANVKARRNEPLSPNWRELVPGVIVAPEKFVYDNYSGSFANWQQLGKWENDNLVLTREELPEQTVEYIKKLTANITDPKLKAKKIYEYMQQKTHYISIQVGIGGFRPFQAAEVDKDGYGDCKALVNYTKALLKVAGIESYYCLVYGNPDEKLSMINDFASMQGNHAILCIPFKNDTTWCECTSQQIPFGFLGDFTDDRLVLACTPEGGKLMHTPKYSTTDNLEKRNADFTLTETGDLSGSMETVFKGTNYDDRYRIIAKSQGDRVKDIRKYYPINNMDIKSLVYKQDKSIKPVTFENIKLTAREFAAVNDKKFYFLINSVDRYTEAEIPKSERNRQSPVSITRGHTYEDDITYTIPKGYKLDSEPLDVKLEKPFGSFMATMTLDGDRLVYKRKLQVKDGTYSRDIYGDVVDFYQAIADADNYNVVLVKN